MGWARAALALVALGAVAAVLVSGGSEADPRTPAGLPGMPPPFLGTAVVGDGGLTAAIDAYGDVVDLRAPGPAGRALIDNPADRQAAGTVPVDTGIVPWVWVGGEALPPWRADSVAQRYLPGANVVRTVARFGQERVEITTAARGQELAMVVEGDPDVQLRVDADLACGQERRGRMLVMVCSPEGHVGQVIAQARRVIGETITADRRWLNGSRPLSQSAPPWAERIYERSLLALRALTDRRTGAVAAGARDGWAYVWPRDAGAVALAFKAAGYPTEARRIARFLLGLDLSAAARFDGKGQPVLDRGPQGDASGWVAVAARGAGLDPPLPQAWRNLPDYQESSSGNYLANAIASTAADGPKSLAMDDKSAHRWQEDDISARQPLFRRLGDPASGLDSAAAWAVEPFALPWLYPQAREAMLRLTHGSGRFGITPGTAWHEDDPWSAPTAWTAWSLAALAQQERNPAQARGDRRAALHLLNDLRRSATPAGTLPERVDARTGIPRSTTPLAWSHAFAVLALRELWPLSRTASTSTPSRSRS